MIACRMSVVSAEHLGIAQEIYAAVVADTSKSVHQSHDHDGKRTSSHKSRENQKKNCSEETIRCRFECTEGLCQGSTKRLALINDCACFRYS